MGWLGLGIRTASSLVRVMSFSLCEEGRLESLCFTRMWQHATTRPSSSGFACHTQIRSSSCGVQLC